MKTAIFVRDVDGFAGIASLYKVDPPMEYNDYDYDNDGQYINCYTEYVVVSATVAMFSGPEAYIFPADAEGKIGLTEMRGSFRGSMDHVKALENAGYKVVMGGEQ